MVIPWFSVLLMDSPTPFFRLPGMDGFVFPESATPDRTLILQSVLLLQGSSFCWDDEYGGWLSNCYSIAGRSRRAW